MKKIELEHPLEKEKKKLVDCYYLTMDATV